MFSNIYTYRFFIVNSVKNEFITKFAKSKLGVAWAILHPLAQVLIYATILSSVLSAKLPGIDSKYAYAIYLMSGMLCWMLFSEIFSRCIGIFTDNANIIKKMSFPKIVLPVTVVLSSVINNLILFAAIAVVFAFLGHFAGVNLIFLPIFSLVTVMLAVGFGLFFGVINVFMRDVGQIIAIVLQFLFWLTPIVYMTSILPSNLQELIYINPLVGVVSGYHDILIYDKMPDFSLLIYPAFIGAASLGVAFFVYKRAEEEMADVLLFYRFKISAKLTWITRATLSDLPRGLAKIKKKKT